MPHYWIVDPAGRSIEAFTLSEGRYQLVTRAAGPTPVALPPFPDLTFAPESLWP